jgi:hypothetical protein
VPVGVEVVGVDLVEVVVVVVVGGVEDWHPGARNVSSSRVTEPLRASARPTTTVSVVTVIDVSAMIVPSNLEPVPSVAELPTCQNTLQAWASFTRLTLLEEAVIKVEAA